MAALSTEELAAVVVGAVLAGILLLVIVYRLLRGCSVKGRTKSGKHDIGQSHAKSEEAKTSSPDPVVAFDVNDEVLRSPMMGVEQELAHESLCIIKTLAEGDFCKVSQGEAASLVQQDISTTVLIKSLNATAPPAARQQFMNEMKVLCRLDHPNILPLLAVCSETDPLSLVFEHSDLGTLKDYLAMARQVKDSGGDTGTFSMLRTSDLSGMALDVVNAVECLHSKTLLHTDVASRHCWVTAGGTVKLAPFQHLVPLNNPDDYSVVSDYTNLEGFRSAQTLPVRWMSPECLRGAAFSMGSDVWSLGVTLWEIFAMGELPYKNYSDNIIITRVPLEGSWLAQPDMCPNELWPIIQKCLVPDIPRRSTASSLREKLSKLHSSIRRNNMLIDLGNTGGGSGSQFASVEELT